MCIKAVVSPWLVVHFEESSQQCTWVKWAISLLLEQYNMKSKKWEETEKRQKMFSLFAMTMYWHVYRSQYSHKHVLTLDISCFLWLVVMFPVIFYTCYFRYCGICHKPFPSWSILWCSFTILVVLFVQDNGQELLHACVSEQWDVAEALIKSGGMLEAQDKVINYTLQIEQVPDYVHNVIIMHWTFPSYSNMFCTLKLSLCNKNRILISWQLPELLSWAVCAL